MEGWTGLWYKAFKDYADDFFPICNICGIHSIGDMCTGRMENEKKWDQPIYISFD